MYDSKLVEAYAKLAGAFCWPVATFAIVLVFRAELLSLLSKLRELMPDLIYNAEKRTFSFKERILAVEKIAEEAEQVAQKKEDLSIKLSSPNMPESERAMTRDQYEKTLATLEKLKQDRRDLLFKLSTGKSE